jgi:hypothetical protein
MLVILSYVIIDGVDNYESCSVFGADPHLRFFGRL